MREKEKRAASEQEKVAFNRDRDMRLLCDDEREAVGGGATAIEYGAAIPNPTWKP